MSLSARDAAAAKYRQCMQRSNQLHGSYLDEPALLEQYDRFTEWQMAYLLTFFADLHERPGYGEAIDYTVSDLAGVGISDRDRDLERALRGSSLVIAGAARSRSRSRSLIPTPARSLTV